MQRFIKIGKAVAKSLVDFRLEKLMVSDNELKMIENLEKSFNRLP